MLADLVLEGGGLKSIGLVSALSVLEAEFRFERVAGVSTGALVGALVAAGVRSEDVLGFLDQVPELLHPGAQAGSSPVELGVEGLSTAPLISALSEVLGSRDVHTFGDLKRSDAQRSSLPAAFDYRLVVVASDVSGGGLVRFPWDFERLGLDPDAQEVAAAVVASMALPSWFGPFAIGSTRESSTLVADGMINSDFPIEMFDRRDSQPPRWPTFGLKISGPKPMSGPMDDDTREEVDRYQTVWSAGSPLAESSPLLCAMTDSIHEFREATDIDPAKRIRTILIDGLGVSSSAVDLNFGMRFELMQSGREAAADFLATWDFEAHLDDYKGPFEPREAKARIFLSYGHGSHRGKTHDLVEHIESWGYSLFWDGAITAGARFPREIEDALAACDAVVVVWTEASLSSSWVHSEALKGRDLGKVVIPVLFEPVENAHVPIGLYDLDRLDLTEWVKSDTSAEMSELKLALELATSRDLDC